MMKTNILLNIFFLCFVFSLTYCADLKLCKDKQLKGKCETIKVNKNQCITLKDKKWAKSLNTNGNCFRLYEKEKCEGKTIFVNSNTPNNNDLSRVSFSDRIVSVGECFSEDKCGRRRKRQATRSCRWANEELTIGFLPWLSRDRDNLTPPVSYYQRSRRNGRTEVMEAIIERRHLNTGTPTNQGARDYAHRMGRQNDDAGHILASRLGGSGTDLRNIFPQSLNFNRGVWAREVEGWVARIVETEGRARFTINLVYDSDGATRPVLLVYRILGGNDNFIVQGDILNP